VLNKEDYIHKMNEHLSCGSYRRVNSNPIPKVIKQVKKAIMETNLEDKIKKKLIPSCEVIPRIYGLPKIHKEGVPLRPIVNTIGSPTYELAKYVAKILKPLVSNTDSFIKDSSDFVKLIRNKRVDKDDILASFDVVSLFTTIPLDEAVHVIKMATDPGTAKLAEICLRSTFFSFQDHYYEQISGVAMGSSLSPIVANLYMEHFERKALDSFHLKPAWWKRFVDDTNLNWTHGKAELEKFFNHLNSISSEIKFTMELEENGKIPFLDVLINRKEDGTLGHQVYRKKTHTDSYLHADSYHHPSQKFGILNTLAVRAFRISDPDHLKDEIDHLTTLFKNIGYREWSIKRAIRRAQDRALSKHPPKDKKENHGKVYLPFIKGVTDKIAKILRKNNIDTQFTTCGMIRQMMRSVKDNIDRQQLKGVYKIDCSCGKSYIGETGRSLKIRLKEHAADIKNERSRTSALAEHSSKTKHHVCLEDAKVIAREDNYHKRKIREAIEIMKFPQNLNRDNGSEISGNWLPLIRQINPSGPLEA